MPREDRYRSSWLVEGARRLGLGRGQAPGGPQGAADGPEFDADGPAQSGEDESRETVVPMITIGVREGYLAGRRRRPGPDAAPDGGTAGDHGDPRQGPGRAGATRPLRAALIAATDAAMTMTGETTTTSQMMTCIAGPFSFYRKPITQGPLGVNSRRVRVRAG